MQLPLLDPDKAYTIEIDDLTSQEDADELVEDALAWYAEFLRDFLGGGPDDGSLNTGHIFVLMTLSRFRALQEGASREMRANNPASCFALIRGMVEMAAVVVYAEVKPRFIEAVFVEPRERERRGVSWPQNQKLIQTAAGNGLPGLREIWRQLSDIAHFSSSAIAQEVQSVGEGRFRWAPVRGFDDYTYKLAAKWLAELTVAFRYSVVRLVKSWVPGN